MRSTRYATPRNATRSEIPILDLLPVLQGGDLDAVARDLRRACETSGFFYVRNHGITPAVVKAAFTVSRRYFSLPLDQRLNHKIDEKYKRGFMPQGINQQTGYAPDRHESFDFMIVAGRWCEAICRWRQSVRSNAG